LVPKVVALEIKLASKGLRTPGVKGVVQGEYQFLRQAMDLHV